MTLLCYYCGSEITWKRKRVLLINICQNPSVLHFCNRDCKLNWIFKKPDLKLEKEIDGNQIKGEDEFFLEMAAIEEKTEDLKEYLKENNLKILREA